MTDHYNGIRLHDGENWIKFGGFLGAPVLRGTNGDDRIDNSYRSYDVRTGPELIYGGPGNDVLQGFRGVDVLDGGPGDDWLDGDNKNSTPDRDLLDGGPGADFMDGELGADIFVFARGDSTTGAGDVISDFDPSEGDIIVLQQLGGDLTITGLIDAQRPPPPWTWWYAINNSNFSDYVLTREGGDGVRDDRILTLPDGGKVTLLNVADVTVSAISKSIRVAPHDIFSSFNNSSTWRRDLHTLTEVDTGGTGGDTDDAPSTGGGGAERIIRDGGPGDDRIDGGEGRDWLTGGGGDDDLRGYGENDRLAGNAGDDRLAGMGGRDNLNGGPGDDTIYGGSGNDLLDGESGDDKLYAGSGNDRLYAGSGDDRLSGGSGDDRLFGGGDGDELYGGTGDDELYDEGGAAQLYGGPGDDELSGYGGSDLLSGGPGDDQLRGGDGADIFRFAPGHSSGGDGDVILDFDYAAGDRIMLTGFSSDDATLSNVLDADGDGASDDREITLPDGGEIALLNVGNAVFSIDDIII